jgi:hypothetical protein
VADAGVTATALNEITTCGPTTGVHKEQMQPLCFAGAIAVLTSLPTVHFSRLCDPGHVHLAGFL